MMHNDTVGLKHSVPGYFSEWPVEGLSRGDARSTPMQRHSKNICWTEFTGIFQPEQQSECLPVGLQSKSLSCLQLQLLYFVLSPLSPTRGYLPLLHIPDLGFFSDK